MTAPSGVPAPVALERDRSRLTQRLNMMINRLAGRDDLLLACLWRRERGQPDAPAWFTPSTGWVTIDATFALQGTHPREVNPLTLAGRREHPVIVGLCCHEASHAHSTLWPANAHEQDLPQGVLAAATLLEEPRIERRQIERRPQDRPYLRAQSQLIDLRQFADADDQPQLDRWRAANAALMTLARVDAGVLEPEDTETVEPVLRDRLGDDLDTLSAIWRDAVELPDGDFPGLCEVAQRWVDVLGDPPPSGVLLPGCAADATGHGPPEDSEWEPDGDGTEDEDGADGALAEAMAQTVQIAASEARDEIHADNDAPSAAQEARKAQAEQEAKDLAAQKKSKKTGKSVFAGSRHRLGNRPPTGPERALSREVGEVLRRARFREPVSTRTHSQAPPGRLDTREAMLGSAQRAQRQPVTARPFRHKKRRRAPEPPITLGIMVDSSGSMSWATDLMATLTWTFTHAMTYVDGNAASVIYGNGQATPLARPGRPPQEVATFNVNGGEEVFDRAFDALDGTLNLTTGKGVRMLVVISDGLYTEDQLEAATERTNRMARNGGIILWVINPNSPHFIPEVAKPVPVDPEVPGPEGLPRGASVLPAAMVTALQQALNER